MKGNPEDLKNLADDLQGTLQRHPDAIQNNPDIARDIVNVRDKTNQRYRAVTEKESAYPQKRDDYVP